MNLTNPYIDSIINRLPKSEYRDRLAEELADHIEDSQMKFASNLSAKEKTKMTIAKFGSPEIISQNFMESIYNKPRWKIYLEALLISLLSIIIPTILSLIATYILPISLGLNHSNYAVVFAFLIIIYLMFWPMYSQRFGHLLRRSASVRTMTIASFLIISLPIFCALLLVSSIGYVNADQYTTFSTNMPTSFIISFLALAIFYYATLPQLFSYAQIKKARFLTYFFVLLIPLGLASILLIAKIHQNYTLTSGYYDPIRISDFLYPLLLTLLVFFFGRKKWTDTTVPNPIITSDKYQSTRKKIINTLLYIYLGILILSVSQAIVIEEICSPFYELRHGLEQATYLLVQFCTSSFLSYVQSLRLFLGALLIVATICSTNIIRHFITKKKITLSNMPTMNIIILTQCLILLLAPLAKRASNSYSELPNIKWQVPSKQLNAPLLDKTFGFASPYAANLLAIGETHYEITATESGFRIKSDKTYSPGAIINSIASVDSFNLTPTLEHLEGGWSNYYDDRLECYVTGISETEYLDQRRDSNAQPDYYTYMWYCDEIRFNNHTIFKTYNSLSDFRGPTDPVKWKEQTGFSYPYPTERLKIQNIIISPDDHWLILGISNIAYETPALYLVDLSSLK